jgi:dinuclear metal center YbgI/SA1388 family protein
MITRSSFLKNLLPRLQLAVPLALADSSWDNVGLLFESLHEPKGPARLMLCIDYTLPVAHEAVERSVDVVIAYHPPWFRECKRLTVENLPVLAVAASNGISVYCMHTALDAMNGGINDVLVSFFTQSLDSKSFSVMPIDEATNMGRLVNFFLQECSLETIVETLKTTLNLGYVRVAKSIYGPGGNAIRSLAICVGGGASVLKKAQADVYITGEMSHHDVLVALQRGTHVLLCEHSNTERFYLPYLKSHLQKCLDDCEIVLSESDKEPLSAW